MCPGARIDVRQLETGKPVGIPISVRISGADTEVLHQLSSELQAHVPLPAECGPRTRRLGRTGHGRALEG